MTDQDLIEPSPIADIYCDGIATVEFVTGDNVRITYFAYQQVPGNDPVRVVCARLVRPRSSIVSGQIASMLETLAPKMKIE